MPDKEKLVTVRKMEYLDTDAVIDMMRVFYTSDAVSTNGSEEIYRADVEGCVGNCPYLVGYVFEEDGEMAGYGMLAKGFSTEFGRPCIWVEDIYIKDRYRGRGIAAEFLSLVERDHPGHILRLEVEEENSHAVHVYEKFGFTRLGYTEMIKLV